MTRLLATMPFIALAYVQIVQPVSDRIIRGLLNTQIVWPVLFLLTVSLAIVSRRHMQLRLLGGWTTALLGLFLAFAALSYLWAYSPDDTLRRWPQAFIIFAVVLLPFALERPRIDAVNAVVYCTAAALAINAIFVLTTPPMLEWTGDILGHRGYFVHKQYLGMCASVAIIGAIYMLLSGQRRVFALLLLTLAMWIIFESRSKASLGFMVLAPVLVAVALTLRRLTRLPLALAVAAIPLSYITLTLFMPDLTNRMGHRFFGDPTFTGRTFIWDFIESQAAQRPWLGWGYQSFWHVPNSPITWAPGFVRDMPSTHSGYLNLRLETGYIGLLLFLSAILAVVRDHQQTRISSLSRNLFALSLLTYALVMNLMESIWLVHFDPLWIIFLILVGDILRNRNFAPASLRARRPIVPAQPRGRSFAPNPGAIMERGAKTAI